MAYPLSDNELGVFLSRRRERISPAEADLTQGNGVRRTPRQVNHATEQLLQQGIRGLVRADIDPTVIANLLMTEDGGPAQAA